MGLEEELEFLRHWQSSLTVESPFGLRVIICTDCKVGLHPSHVGGHLKNFHKERDAHASFSGSNDERKIKKIVKLISEDNNLGLSTDAEIKEAENGRFPTALNLPPPFPYLQKVSRKAGELDGPYLCEIKECSTVSTSTAQALKKFREQHSELMPMDSTTIMEGYHTTGDHIGLQRLFSNSFGSRFFAVNLLLEQDFESADTGPISLPSIFNDVLAPYFKVLKQEKQSRKEEVCSDEEIDLCPFERQVAWRTVIRDLNPLALFRFSMQPQVHEDYLQVKRLRDATKAYYNSTDSETWYSVGSHILGRLCKDKKQYVIAYTFL